MPADVEPRRRSVGLLARLGAGDRGAVVRPLAWIIAATLTVCLTLALVVQTQSSTRIPPRLAMQRQWGHPDPQFVGPTLIWAVLILGCAWVGRRLLRIRL